MKKLVGVAPYHEFEIEILRDDREMAIEYARLAVEALTNTMPGRPVRVRQDLPAKGHWRRRRARTR
jgi:hypothetical protein